MSDTQKIIALNIGERYVLHNGLEILYSGFSNSGSDAKDILDRLMPKIIARGFKFGPESGPESELVEIRFNASEVACCISALEDLNPDDFKDEECADGLEGRFRLIQAEFGQENTVLDAAEQHDLDSPSPDI